MWKTYHSRWTTNPSTRNLYSRRLDNELNANYKTPEEDIDKNLPWAETQKWKWKYHGAMNKIKVAKTLSWNTNL